MSPAVRPYHLFVGTPLPVSGNSPPFHRELSIIPHRIRDKDERRREGESSRGRDRSFPLSSWQSLWSLFADSFIEKLLHDNPGEAWLSGEDFDRCFMYGPTTFLINGQPHLVVFVLNRWGSGCSQPAHKCLSAEPVYVEIAREGSAPRGLHINHSNNKNSAHIVVSEMSASGGGAHVTASAALLSTSPLGTSVAASHLISPSVCLLRWRKLCN